MNPARISALLVALASAGALAQQAPSPYSLAMSMGRAPAQGLNVSLVGRAQLASFSLFGKVGSTTYARPETAAMGMAAAGQPDSGGLSWGGGVSYDVTPRLSATFEWISYDLRVPSGPVRSTSLGLQYRY